MAQPRKSRKTLPRRSDRLHYWIEEDNIIDHDDLDQIKKLKTGTFQDEALDFLLAQDGRLPRIAADTGISVNTLYDFAKGRRTNLKCVYAEKILRYKQALGESLLSCQLRKLR